MDSLARGRGVPLFLHLQAAASPLPRHQDTDLAIRGGRLLLSPLLGTS